MNAKSAGLMGIVGKFFLSFGLIVTAFLSVDWLLSIFFLGIMKGSDSWLVLLKLLVPMAWCFVVVWIVKVSGEISGFPWLRTIAMFTVYFSHFLQTGKFSLAALLVCLVFGVVIDVSIKKDEEGEVLNQDSVFFLGAVFTLKMLSAIYWAEFCSDKFIFDNGINSFVAMVISIFSGWAGCYFAFSASKEGINLKSLYRKYLNDCVQALKGN